MARKLLVILLVLVGCLVVSGVASADTAPFFYDGEEDGGDSLLASPDPFAHDGHGRQNTGTGRFVLTQINASISSGFGAFNTADGYGALFADTTGSSNTGLGRSALTSNTTGGLNTATGTNALYSNVSGSSNVAGGFQALFSNTSGMRNAATGGYSLTSNTDGADNVGMGEQALYTNTVGDRNVALGVNALHQLKVYNDNTAVGYYALSKNTGARNIGLGRSAGSALTSGSDNIDIGAGGVSRESKAIRIGTQGTQTATFLAGVSGTAISGPTQTVVVNSKGQLGTATLLGAAARARVHSAAVRSASRATRPGRLMARLRHQQHEIDVLAAEVRALRAGHAGR